jgi:hypothetical protein
MGCLYVVGGQQRAARTLLDGQQDWNGYERGLVVVLDPDTGRADVCLDYVSPPEVCRPHDPAISFQAGTIQDDKLYLCTETEVLVYRLPHFEQLAYVSLPIFNDLHHVRPTPQGTVLVANAGLEQILEITLDGVVVTAWHVLGEQPWDHVQPGVDYRMVSTKPHRSHPNFLPGQNSDVWVTRFHQGDAVCLTDSKRHIPLSDERIHDGVLHNGRFYFTSVTGKVLVASPDSLRVEEVIDVTAMHPPDVLLGWCRSIHIDRNLLWLGFSRIRPTRLRENVSWVMRGFKRAMPTHIACYDLTKGECVAEIDLEPAGLNAVYSILPVPEAKRPDEAHNGSHSVH